MPGGIVGSPRLETLAVGTLTADQATLSAASFTSIATSTATISALTVSSNATLGSSTATATVNYTAWSMPNLPAFMAISTAAVTAVTGDNTAYTVPCGEEFYDRTTSYSTTGVFTAPVAGIYAFAGSVGLTAMTSNHATAKVQVLIGSSVTYTPYLETYSTSAGITALTMPWSLQVLLSSGTTVAMQAVVLGASKGVATAGSTTAPPTFFAGYLVG